MGAYVPTPSQECWLPERENQHSGEHHQNNEVTDKRGASAPRRNEKSMTYVPDFQKRANGAPSLVTAIWLTFRLLVHYLWR
jgi:hypothetical protein